MSISESRSARKIWVLAVHLLPVFAFAQSVLPPAPGPLVPCYNRACSAGDFIILIQNIINFLIYISVPLAVVGLVVGGFKMMWSGNINEITEGKGILMTTLKGFALMISAWLIVSTILKIFVKDPYIFVK